MSEKAIAPGKGGDADDGDEVVCARQGHYPAVSSSVSTRELRCRPCGGPVPPRDYPANHPFDSACFCRSPLPPTAGFEDLPIPNERWFAQQRKAAT